MAITVADLDTELDSLVNWEKFGTHLRGMTYDKIEKITRDKPTTDQQKLALYSKWLSVCPNPSWRDVATALEKAKETALAGKIRQSAVVEESKSIIKVGRELKPRVEKESKPSSVVKRDLNPTSTLPYDKHPIVRPFRVACDNRPKPHEAIRRPLLAGGTAIGSGMSSSSATTSIISPAHTLASVVASDIPGSRSTDQPRNIIIFGAGMSGKTTVLNKLAANDVTYACHTLPQQYSTCFEFNWPGSLSSQPAVVNCRYDFNYNIRAVEINCNAEIADQPERQTKEYKCTISREIGMLLHNEVNLTIFVINKAMGFTKEALFAINLVVDLYGDVLSRNNSALVITHCDNISRDEVMQIIYQSHILQKYMGYFGDRVFVFGNYQTDEVEITKLRLLVENSPEKIAILNKQPIGLAASRHSFLSSLLYKFFA